MIERIEELRKALSRLQEHVDDVLKESISSKRYEDFVRATTDWVWETDAHLSYVFASDGIARTFGVPARAMVGTYLFSLTHYKKVDEDLLALVELIQNHRPFRNVALCPVDEAGRAHRILLSGVPVFDAQSGRFTGYRGTADEVVGRDQPAAHPLPAEDEGDAIAAVAAAVTAAAAGEAPEAPVAEDGAAEEGAAEDEAEYIETRYREAVDAGRVGVWDWNIATGRMYLAPCLEAMLGYDEGGFGGHIDDWRRHIHPDDRARLRESIDAHLEGRSPAFELDHRMIDCHGDTKWLVSRGRAVNDSEGEIVRLVGTSTDLTERKNREETLRAATEAAEVANRTKTEFLAHLSHELRTPLNAIIGFSEAIKEGYLGPLSAEKSQEYASDVHAASTHLLELINDLLDLSKLESGQVHLDEEEFDVRDMVSSSVRLVEGRAASGWLNLIVEVAKDLPYLRADSRMIKQVMLNLLTNAIKFTDKGGDITVRAGREADGGVALEVSDTGIGMEEADIPTALSPFGQIGAAGKMGLDGAGLGLPLAKSLVELHGGSLELHSQKGHGTDVVVRFPPYRSVA